MPRKTEGDLERALLGSLFQDPKQITSVGTIIDHNDFFSYGKIYTALKNSILKGKFDLGETPSILAEKFGFNLSSIYQHWDLMIGYKPQDIAKKIKEKANIRRFIEAVFKAKEEAENNPEDIEKIIETVQKDIFKISLQDYKETEGIKNIIEEFKKRQEEYLIKKESGADYIGIPTNFPTLDEMIDGLRKNHIWVIGGYTSTGKSSFALNIVNNIVKQNKRVVLYTLEMGKVDILGKLTALNIGHSPSYIIKNADDNELYRREADYFTELSEKELLIHSKYHTIEQIILSMMKNNLEKPVDLFVVDYIQNIDFDKRMSEYEMMTYAAREFQKMAEKLEVPIILLSQVSNVHARESISNVMGFKGSGGIAAVADFAIELRRDKEFLPDSNMCVPMKAHIMKNRHGAIGEVELNFNLRSGLIEEKLFAQKYDNKTTQRATIGIDL